MKDKKALSQLQLIGDVSQAKYRFLSEEFMRRHGLGLFAAESKSDTDGQSVSQRKKKRRKQTVQDIEPESDAEWIVSALGQDDNNVGRNSPIDSSIDISFGSGGTSISAGFEVGIG